MAFVDWQIEGMELVNCNCNQGCPCQFNSPPTHGHCRAHIWVHVERGHFGDVKLDDTRFGIMAAWPGAIHQGNGTHQVFVDDRTTPEQHQALETIAKGKETEPGKVIWFIYAAMSTTFLPTVTARIDLTMDADAREATVVRRGYPRRHGVAHPKPRDRPGVARTADVADGNRIHGRGVRQRDRKVERPDRHRLHQDSRALRQVQLEYPRRRSIVRWASPPRPRLRARSRGPDAPLRSRGLAGARSSHDSSRTRTRSRSTHPIDRPRWSNGPDVGMDHPDGPGHVRPDDRSGCMDDDAGLGCITRRPSFRDVDRDDERHDAAVGRAHGPALCGHRSPEPRSHAHRSRAYTFAAGYLLVWTIFAAGRRLASASPDQSADPLAHDGALQPARVSRGPGPRRGVSAHAIQACVPVRVPFSRGVRRDTLARRTAGALRMGIAHGLIVWAAAGR